MSRKPGPDKNARIAALHLLGGVLDRGETGAEPELDDPRDRAYSRHLFYGVLRWLSALEWLASQLLDRPLRKKDRDVQRLILLGLFQLWKDGTAEHAAVNETAACARLLGKPWATGLVNAVLRRFQREHEQLLQQLEHSEERFAHPHWLIEAIRADWPDDWENILRANNRPAGLWLRCRSDGSEPAPGQELDRAGLDVTQHPLVPSAIRIEPARSVEEIPGFAAGRLSVQDPAAQIAAGLLDCRPGQRVLDACAAPGGKTGHLLELNPEIELLAIDRSADRLELVRDNLERLGLAHRATLRAADAADTRTWWDGHLFDRILLDAPCTATGVIRRHPEIKWLRSPAQVGQAVTVQAGLLDALWPLLRPGGILLYATCSVLRRENALQVGAFLERQADARVEKPDLPWGRDAAPGRQILPGELEMDGFFYARISKSE
ncbi:MAG: 16S rRNA (cytosine(967)-C(5))-methyltransferase RsmB [Xanthomonadales bacterium]|jgi:16S rRNA (cytosine967-C5)-methyltransferase|nr:16S rRNA (cytosine(967)-C(5))-methyltransferase RsmB [Xanthomonadales bacterium]